MRISRLYLESALSSGAHIQLPADSAHYLGTVLRAREGDKALLFNARDGEFEATVITSKKGRVEVELGVQTRVPHSEREGKALFLHLALGLSRGDRMDYAIQKATELGVSKITPLFTEHGEVKLKQDRLENKLRHFQKICVNAAEQCGRLDVPELDTPVSVEEFLAQDSHAVRVLLEPGGDGRLSRDEAINSIEILIGPEGGFSKRELELAQNSECLVVGLGPRVLRTETAPVAALAVLQFLYGDLG